MNDLAQGSSGLPPQANRVLVVEDDPHLAAGVVENLRAEGYETHAVTDGRQALDWLGEQHVGLIVLDVMLPEVDGFTRSEEHTSELQSP